MCVCVCVLGVFFVFVLFVLFSVKGISLALFFHPAVRMGRSIYICILHAIIVEKTL